MYLESTSEYFVKPAIGIDGFNNKYQQLQTYEYTHNIGRIIFEMALTIPQFCQSKSFTFTHIRYFHTNLFLALLFVKHILPITYSLSFSSVHYGHAIIMHVCPINIANRILLDYYYSCRMQCTTNWVVLCEMTYSFRNLITYVSG